MFLRSIRPNAAIFKKTLSSLTDRGNISTHSYLKKLDKNACTQENLEFISAERNNAEFQKLLSAFYKPITHNQFESIKNSLPKIQEINAVLEISCWNCNKAEMLQLLVANSHHVPAIHETVKSLDNLYFSKNRHLTQSLSVDDLAIIVNYEKQQAEYKKNGHLPHFQSFFHSSRGVAIGDMRELESRLNDTFNRHHNTLG